MFDFRRITLFCLEKRLSRHKMTIFLKILGRLWPLCPPGYAYDINFWSEHLSVQFHGICFYMVAGPWEPPPAPPGRGGPQPCLGAPPQLQYFYCFTFLILKIIIYISIIKCHGQLAGTGGGHQLNHPRHLCCTKAFSNLQAWKRK